MSFGRSVFWKPVLDLQKARTVDFAQDQDSFIRFGHHLLTLNIILVDLQIK